LHPLLHCRMNASAESKDTENVSDRANGAGSKWQDLWQNSDPSDNGRSQIYPLCVSNLPPTVNALDLKNLFEKVSDLVAVNVMIDPATGQSLGWGIVDYGSSSASEDARSRFHNTSLSGRRIEVSRSSGKRSLYIGNLPLSDTEETITRRVGALSAVPLRRCIKRNNHKYGFLEFDTHRHAQAALVALKNAVWESNEIRVEVAGDKESQSQNRRGGDRRPSNQQNEQRPSMASKGSDRRYSDHRQHSDYDDPRWSFNGNFDGNHFHGDFNGLSGAAPKRQNNGDFNGEHHSDGERRRTLYLRALSTSTSDEELQSLFGRFGALTRCNVVRSNSSRRSNFGFVQFESVAAAESALDELNGVLLNGQPLEIEFSRSLPGERRRRLQHRRPNHRQNAAQSALRGNGRRSRSAFQQKASRQRAGRGGHSRSRSRAQSRSRSRDRSRSRSRSRSRRRKNRSISPRRDREEQRRGHSPPKNNEDAPRSDRETEHNDAVPTLCVNLPNEFDPKQHLIGFDPKQSRYLLFAVKATSSSLRKMQAVAAEMARGDRRRRSLSAERRRSLSADGRRSPSADRRGGRNSGSRSRSKSPHRGSYGRRSGGSEQREDLGTPTRSRSRSITRSRSRSPAENSSVMNFDGGSPEEGEIEEDDDIVSDPK